ncbi:hypothetical protein [uncultured Parasphingopyxis sp.]|uniref:hypothetical protein n=1 Tax=uncultured Parasphingopyxis sp. TaxID=1547918 RepID=UPI00261AEC89|nr:hypothetical protein [uncultured Parasphingopyxis sp.]
MAAIWEGVLKQPFSIFQIDNVDRDDPLHGSKILLARANEGLLELERICDSHFTENPPQIREHVDRTSGERVFTLAVEKTLPPLVEVLVGEIIHRLRTALDHLVAAFVRLNGKEPDQLDAFPIARTKRQHRQACVAKLAKIDIKGQSFLSGVNAFKSGNEPIWLLAKIDNADKHDRLLRVDAIVPKVNPQLGLPALFIGDEPAGFHLGPLDIQDDRPSHVHVQNGAELLRIKWGGPIRLSDTKFIIVFDRPQEANGLNMCTLVLSQMDAVERIVRDAEAEFFAGPG